MSNYEAKKLSEIINYTTGKLNSNAAEEGGKYPFFTCARETYRTDTWSFDCECVILAGNNANAEYPIKYFNGGKFDAYQRTYVMTPKDEDELDIRYLYYVLELKLNLLKTLSTGATTKFLTKTILDDLKIDLPDIEIQKKIVSNLAPLEDLIENNARRIEILEEMARRIYREWFVHIRYPGHEDDTLVDSDTELGEIPEGWEVRKLEDVAEINPENISTDYEGEIEYINISGVNEGSIDETEIHDFEQAPGRAKRRVKNGDIIWSSVRPNLKAYALILNPPANQIASTGFAVIRPKKLPASFLYNFSTTEYFVQYLVNHTRGSAYPAVNVSDFKNALIIVPDEKLVEKFDEITWSNFQQIDKLSRKNKKLKETRDLLLPKLISGKIEVEEVNLN